ncbi:MAG: hypothetical protein JSU96_08560, partial [Acidobacteriota bacterium]
QVDFPACFPFEGSVRKLSSWRKLADLPCPRASWLSVTELDMMSWEAALALYYLILVPFLQVPAADNWDCEIRGMTVIRAEAFCSQLCSPAAGHSSWSGFASPNPDTDSSTSQEELVCQVAKAVYESLGFLDTVVNCFVDKSVRGYTEIRVAVTEQGPRYRIRSISVYADATKVDVDPERSAEFLIRPRQEYNWQLIQVSALRLCQTSGYSRVERIYKRTDNSGEVDVRIDLKDRIE